MSKLMKAAAGWVGRYWLDGLCLLLSVAFFTLFLRNSLVMSSGALGYRAKVGRLEAGPVNRKGVDAPMFAEIKPVADLYDRDALWSPPASGLVRVRLSDGTLFDISPGSLVVLRKSENLKAPGLVVDIISGSVEILEASKMVIQGLTQFKVGEKPMPPSEVTKGSKLGKEAKKPEPAPSQAILSDSAPAPSGTPLPSLTPAPSPSPSNVAKPKPPGAVDSSIHPRESMKYYVMTSQVVELTFSWPDLIAGDLVVRPLGGKGKGMGSEIRVKGAKPRGTTAPIKVGPHYEWSIENAQGAVVSGPHHFSVEPFSGQQVIDTVGGTEESMVEILQ
jgi:hypothetical protein